MKIKNHIQMRNHIQNKFRINGKRNYDMGLQLPRKWKYDFTQCEPLESSYEQLAQMDCVRKSLNSTGPGSLSCTLVHMSWIVQLVCPSVTLHSPKCQRTNTWSNHEDMFGSELLMTSYTPPKDEADVVGTCQVLTEEFPSGAQQ